MFADTISNLVEEMALFLKDHAIRNNLTFNADLFRQSSITLESFAGQVVCFGYDVWPANSDTPTPLP